MSKTAWGLSGNQLKLIALITMTLDHIGLQLLPQYPILRILGRLALPIYAFLIAEGCHYTRNKFKYLALMATLALGCQLVYFFTMRSLYMCILVTFSLSILLIYALQYMQRAKNAWSCLLFFALLAGAYYITVKLPGRIPGFSVDYGLIGVLLPVFFAMGSTKSQKILGGAVGICLMAMNSSLQWYCLMALPLLALYSGRRGKGDYKYLFYIYYPLHLAAIYGISLAMKYL